MPAQTVTGFSVIDTYNIIREDMEISPERDYEQELLELEQQQQVLPPFNFFSSSSSSSSSNIPQASSTSTTSSSSSSSSSPSPSPYSPYHTSPSPLHYPSSTSPAPHHPHHHRLSPTPYSSSSSSSSSSPSPHCVPLPSSPSSPSSAPSSSSSMLQQTDADQPPLPPPPPHVMSSFPDMDTMMVSGSFLDQLIMGDDDDLGTPASFFTPNPSTTTTTITPLQPLTPLSQPPPPSLSSFSSSPTTTTTTRTTYVTEVTTSGSVMLQRERGAGAAGGMPDQQLMHTDLLDLYDLDRQSFYEEAGWQEESGLKKEKEEEVEAAMAMVGHSSEMALLPGAQGRGEPKLTELGPVALGEQEDVLNVFKEIHADIVLVCCQLGISANPKDWSARDSQAWVRYMAEKNQLAGAGSGSGSGSADDASALAALAVPGALLCQKSPEELSWLLPKDGDFLHQQLELWAAVAGFPGFSAPKTQDQSLVPSADVHLSPLSSAATPPCLPPSVSPSPSMDSVCSPHSSSSQSSSDGDVFWTQDSSEEDLFQDSNADLSPSEPPKSSRVSSSKAPSGGRPGKQIRLWEFLKELLEDSDPSMKWLDRTRGIFKIEDSTRVSKLWGTRKNHPAMNYDKLSRSVRQYYKKGIIKKTTQTRRLVYQFCERYL